MTSDFFAMARFQMALPGDVEGVDGGLIVAAGLPLHTLSRRRLDRLPYLNRHLLDPQLYLVGLSNPALSRKACANLASYGWFPVRSLPEFNSSEQRQADWNRSVRANIHRAWIGEPQREVPDIELAARDSIETQVRLGCESLILPSPLTTELNTDYSLELAWLDQSLSLASRAHPSLLTYATIALSDSCLRVQDPWTNPLLELILDQVTSREPGGAYIVIEGANENGYYITHPNTVGSLLRLVYGLKQGGIEKVTVSFVGTAGLLALAAGADAWSAGWYRGERRLKLSDFEEQIGLAVPTYYSHRLASEIHLEADLDRIKNLGFLDRVSDETPASTGLLRALRGGLPALSVPEWRYRKSNVKAAREHFLSVAVRETTRLRGMNADQRLEYAEEWLSNADRLASELMSEGGFNQRTELRHQANWYQAFARFLREVS